jgi:hypothetical protein
MGVDVLERLRAEREAARESSGATGVAGPDSHDDQPKVLSVTEFVDPVVQVYYPRLLPTVHACLAVFAAMAFQERTKPLCLILETPSGYGKSAVLQMFFPKPNAGLDKYVYRSDKFTPKSFVTHAASVKKEDLPKLDLLPKLKGKVLVTKELAPIFRGRDEEMQENFSTLISVPDMERDSLLTPGCGAGEVMKKQSCSNGSEPLRRYPAVSKGRCSSLRHWYPS